MDDLKIYAENDTNLTSLINIVKTFSDDIRMSFGLNKCNKLTIVKGEVVQRENIVLNNGDELQSLDNNAHYKYLGFNERETTDKRSKSLIQNEYFTRIKRIMKTELNSKNTISAINTYAVPSLAYGFVILDWSITELETIDRETRKLLQKYHLMLHGFTSRGRMVVEG